VIHVCVNFETPYSYLLENCTS